MKGPFVAALASAALLAGSSEAGPREDLIDVLSSPEMKDLDTALQGIGGDFGRHFVRAEWRGGAFHHNVETENSEETGFVIVYQDNFGGAICNVLLMLEKEWLGKEPSKVTKKVTIVDNGCASRMR